MTQARNSRGQFAKTAVNDTIDEMYENFSPYFEGLPVRYPMAGVIVNLVTTGLGVYFGFQFAGYIAIAAVLMTGSTFIGILIGLIGAVVSLIQALRFGAAAGRWISTGQFEVDYQRAKSTVLGWFNRKEEAHV